MKAKQILSVIIILFTLAGIKSTFAGCCQSSEQVKQGAIQSLSKGEQEKKDIKKNIDELMIKLTSTTEIKTKSEQKGWYIEPESESQQVSGTLYDLYLNIEPSKKRVLQNIDDEFRDYDDGSIERQISNLANETRRKIDKLPHIMIESKIKEYFEQTKKMGKTDIRNKKEGNGVQFGKVVTIIDNQTSTPIHEFYVKTHQLGLESKTGKSAKSVDFKELFAYKFLELCGITPEVHFFYDDDKNFYIATKNDGYSHDEHTKFLTYEKIDDKQNFYNRNTTLVEESFISVDFYTRILYLNDVLSQGGNIGFIQKAGAYESDGFRIIDFRVPEPLDDYQLKGIRNGWKIGNNQFSGGLSDLIREIIFSADIGDDDYQINLDKLLKKKNILKQFLARKNLDQNKLAANSKTSFDDIKKYIDQLQKDDKDLKLYLIAVQKHINDLYQEIMS